MQVDPSTAAEEQEQEPEQKQKQGKGKAGEKRFVIKKWNAVAMWVRWDRGVS